MRSFFSSPKTPVAPTAKTSGKEAISPELPGSVNHLSSQPIWRASIRQQHLLLILLIFLPLLIIQTYSAFVEYGTQRQSVLDGQIATARSISRTAIAFINDQVSSNRALGYSFNGSQNLTTEQGNAILADFRKQTPFVFVYRFISLDGKVLYADPPLTVNYDFTQEPYFKQILAGADSIVTDLRQSVTDRTTPVFYVISPVHAPDNRLVGMMVASIDTTKLGSVFSITIGQRQRGSLTIHDRQSNVIYNSQQPDMSYQRKTSGAKLTSVMAALKGKEQVLEYTKSNIDGLEKLGASVPITLGANDWWSASIAEPIEDAMSPTTNIIVPRIVTFLIVAIMAFMAAWLYSRYLIRPILKLREAAGAFGQGDLDQRIYGKNHNAELEELAQSFNQMADRIASETRSKDAFLSQAAHELKTPITVIKASTQLIIRNQEREEQELLKGGRENQEQNVKQRSSQLKLLRGMDHQNDRMIELINRLLELSRLQSGRVEYHFEIVDFEKLLERGLDAARQLTNPETHPLEFVTTPGKKWLVKADTARMEQVILNLLENALKYSPDGGVIRVKLREYAAGEPLPVAGLELSIQDSGLGLEPEDLEHLFERYHRTRNGNHNISGLGLGLYISAEIVRQHGGRIWATSPGAGQGSTFYLALPTIKDEEESQKSEGLG